MGLVLAAMIGSMDVAPALADNDHGRRGKHDKGRYERGHVRDRHDYGRRRVYQTYGYRERVYVPPPVVYEPPPPPGISFFFPPIVIRP